MSKYFVIPNMTALQYLMPLVKGIWNHAENKPSSGTVVRTWIREGIVRINSETVKIDEVIDYPVFSIVVFPKSSAKRVTLL